MKEKPQPTWGNGEKVREQMGEKSQKKEKSSRPQNKETAR
jgi:hypothetical protein